MLKSCTIYMITYKLDSLPDVGWANYMNIWDKSLNFGRLPTLRVNVGWANPMNIWDKLLNFG